MRRFLLEGLKPIFGTVPRRRPAVKQRFLKIWLEFAEKDDTLRLWGEESDGKERVWLQRLHFRFFAGF